MLTCTRTCPSHSQPTWFIFHKALPANQPQPWELPSDAMVTQDVAQTTLDAMHAPAVTSPFLHKYSVILCHTSILLATTATHTHGPTQLSVGMYLFCCTPRTTTHTYIISKYTLCIMQTVVECPRTTSHIVVHNGILYSESQPECRMAEDEMKWPTHLWRPLATSSTMIHTLTSSAVWVHDIHL